MSKRILLLGYFGYISNQLDGQTIKTRDVKKLLELNLGKDGFKYFDTQSLKNNKFNYFKLLFLLIWCKHLIYLPGKSNLSGLSGVVSLLINLKGLSVYYLVVGGWLSSFLEEKPKLLSLLKKFKYIGAESKTLAFSLDADFGLENVGFFPNFRIHNFSPVIRYSHQTLKLVFMARIMLEKGIDILFQAASIIDKKSLDITISFYGPIAEKDKEYFFENINKIDCVEYKGVIEPPDVNLTVSMYDALVLLTKFKEEGFPGSVLDAYISGLPVIVSNWRFSGDFVDEGKTGFIVNNIDEFIARVVLLCENKKLLLDMKNASFEKSKDYSSASAWKVLESYLSGGSCG